MWGYCGVQFFFVSLQIINYILIIMENRDMSLFDFILLCFKALSKLVKNVAVLFLGLVIEQLIFGDKDTKKSWNVKVICFFSCFE